jgi:hypothetical protein
MFKHATIVTFIIFLVQACVLSNAPSNHVNFHIEDISAAGLCLKRLGQSSDLLIEELLGLLPDPRVGPVVKGEKARQEGFAEHLGALTGEQRWEVVNANHAQGWAVLQTGDGDCGLIESGGDIIQGNGVEGVGAR